MRSLPEDIRSKLVDALVSADQRWAFNTIGLVSNLNREQCETYVAYIRASAPKASGPEDFMFIVLTPLVHLVGAAERERLEFELLKAWDAQQVSEPIAQAFSRECQTARSDWVARDRDIGLPPSAPRASVPPLVLDDVETRVDLARRFLESNCYRLTTALRKTDFGYSWGNGYLLGVMDATRQHVLGNVPPKTEDYAAAMIIFGSIHGEMRGARVLQGAMQAQDIGDQDFIRGMRIGGTEALSFFRGASVGASFESPPAKGTGMTGIFRKWFGADR